MNWRVVEIGLELGFSIAVMGWFLWFGVTHEEGEGAFPMFWICGLYSMAFFGWIFPSLARFEI